MTGAGTEAIARAVLYEGFALYPYRASALKNRRRILFGTLFPARWAAAAGEPSRAIAEVLLRSAADAPRVRMTVRFLHLDDPPREASREGVPVVTRIGPDLFRVRAAVENDAPLAPEATRDEAEAHAMGAAHVVLEAGDGAFASQIDPPPELAAEAAACVQEGLFPVLVGRRPAAATVLAAPIILYDYPEVAPESAGDLFDATEIEEILSLRIATLSPAEREELRRDPDRAALLDRIDALGPEGLARLHGGRRDALAAGARVRIAPRAGGADAFDLLLRGMEATVQSIEHTVCGRELVCVTIDKDPGRDLGARGVPGHRFFFGRDELEVLP